ncbi:hypothetical protein B0T19DRAFT_480037 [Cercophora scortea]|uniref:Uncharacterized protein n=1 Tax=Cercophora scortea TaxID=314031 RepID=A0AAE0MK99_9PEZI|nr:hypothetical protein B0T19DRAFT_480037 [Cercophora scortea]
MNTTIFETSADLESSSGVIAAPRPAPHRTLMPRKSCLRRQGDFAPMRPKSSLPVRFEGSGWEGGVVFGRCMISGDVYRPSNRHHTEWWEEQETLRQEGTPRGGGASSRRKGLAAGGEGWGPSLADDVVMTGVSLEGDLRAALDRADEEELDNRLETARLNSAALPRPIPSKLHRSKHPAVLWSRYTIVQNPEHDQRPTAKSTSSPCPPSQMPHRTRREIEKSAHAANERVWPLASCL